MEKRRARLMYIKPSRKETSKGQNGIGEILPGGLKFEAFAGESGVGKNI